MEKGGGAGSGDVEPATRAAGGRCDRFLTFLAKNLSVSRMKSIADGPRSGAGGVHPPPTEGGDGGGMADDEFAIPIERAEFDFQFGGHGDGGHSGGVAPTILEESAATTTTTRDVPDEQKDGAAAAAASTGGPVVAAPPVPAVEVETKVRRTVTIKEDRPAQDGGGAASATATVERKKSLFRKRQASSVGAGEEQGGAARVPKRSGLRPRMPQVPRVPSNINERSSTFIEERKKPAPEK